jgi:hypothetical protein
LNLKASGEDVSEGRSSEGDAGTFDRSFRAAVIVYAVAGFFAIALLLYYKLAR